MLSKYGVNGAHWRPALVFLISCLILSLIFIGNFSPGQATGGQAGTVAQAQDGPLPVVAVHVSELTQALETMPAAASTPHGNGTTGKEWWDSSWHYFTFYESLEDALNADGTPFVEVSDADIRSGRLLTSAGEPRYPIVISLGAEAVADQELNPLRGYIRAGGFLFVGGAAFTRHPDGSTRDDFALADEMGVHMKQASLGNLDHYSKVTRLVEQRIAADLPGGTLDWSMPASSDQLGQVTKRQPYPGKWPPIWRVTAGNAQVVVNGDTYPLLTVNPFGKGNVIYYAPIDPLISYNGAESGTYAYLFFRRSIEWAFSASALPLIKLSPWPYPYNAAILFRHDFEQDPKLINSIEASAQIEKSAGAKGDYYFTTGLIQVGTGDHTLTNAQKRASVKGLQRAVKDYGATIGSHNGGLPWPGSHPFFSLIERLSFLRSWMIFPFSSGSYDWHWGPDEVLNTKRFGYPDGVTYAYTSIEASFHDLQLWLQGLDNGRTGCGARQNCPRIWVAPYFNSDREGSLQTLERAQVITAGEQKIGPFPHWTLSTQTLGKHYSFLSLPVSEWYVKDRIVQSVEDHSTASLQTAIDFYYNLGALVNFYSHHPSNDGGLEQEYIRYGLSRPRIWSTNAVGVYDWWQKRSTVKVSVAYNQAGRIGVALASLSGTRDPDTAVEIVLPGWSIQKLGDILVLIDGAPAASSAFRATQFGIKILAGGAVSKVEVRYPLP